MKRSPAEARRLWRDTAQMLRSIRVTDAKKIAETIEVELQALGLVSK